jgi:hypothetical protein
MSNLLPPYDSYADRACEEDPRPPLFIPLKAEHYDAFKNGTKRRGPSGFMEEYRRAGGPWNERTCTHGRPVTLSRGYAKTHRLEGRVVGYRESAEDGQHPEFVAIYGPGHQAACIAIQVVA